MSSMTPFRSGHIDGNNSDVSNATKMPIYLPDNHSYMSECFCSDMTIHDYSEFYELFNLIIVILSLPAVSAFGVISNVINVFIYTRNSMRCSANTYLMALAGSDFFVVVTGLFIFWIDSARSYLPSLKYAPYTIVYTLPVGYMAQTCSVYFTVAAAVDCYIKLCWSRVWPQYNTVRRSRQIVVLIVLGSCLYNSLRFGQFNLRVCKPEALNGTVSIVEICPTPLYFHINEVYNVYMYMALMTFLPFLLLLLLNAFIMLRLGPDKPRPRQQSAVAYWPPTSSIIRPPPATVLPESDYQHPPGTIIVANPPQTLNTTSATAADAVSEEPDDTITMIMVVVMFLACNTLALIVNIVETFMDPSALVLNYMTDASNFLVIFNSSVNFVIYMIFSKEFLHLFKHHFCCKSSIDQKSNGYSMVAAANNDRFELSYQPSVPPSAVSIPEDPIAARSHLFDPADVNTNKGRSCGGHENTRTNNNNDVTLVRRQQSSRYQYGPPDYDELCLTDRFSYGQHASADGSVTRPPTSPRGPFLSRMALASSSSGHQALMCPPPGSSYLAEVNFLDDSVRPRIVVRPIDAYSVEKFV